MIEKEKWIAKLKDNTVVEQDSVLWKDVKDNIQEMSFVCERFKLNLPGNAKEYFQKRSASCDVLGGTFIIDSKTVGFTTPCGDKVMIQISSNNKTLDIIVE